ncbi:unnamed protein product [Discosporangium mesarthrocarpum]
MGEASAALRSVFAEAGDWAAEKPGRRCAVVFLDEADALLARRGDGEGERGRALTQLLTLMDGFHSRGGSGRHVIVVGATNRPGALDPALRRPGRFDREVAIAPPSEAARLEILRLHLGAVEVEGREATLREAAEACTGYVAADLAALARETVLVGARRTWHGADGGGHRGEHVARFVGEMKAVVTAADLASGMEKVGASLLRGHEVLIPDTPWSDIGGMDEAKSKLQQAVEWPVTNKAAFQRLGLTAPRGILLFGPPGCSKTTLVRAAATSAGATFVSLSGLFFYGSLFFWGGADVFSPYLGEAEAAVRRAFLLARNAAPALLFFDEIDAIVSNREQGDAGAGSSSSAESRVLATFLTEMDGVGATKGDGVIVVGATNRPEAVDKALLRPGRFDRLIYTPLPDSEARRQIFAVHTRKVPLDIGVDFGRLAEASSGLTGAEIKGVCREAAMSCLREAGPGARDTQHAVTMRHLMAATLAAAATPGVTREMVKGFEGFIEGRPSQ